MNEHNVASVNSAVKETYAELEISLDRWSDSISEHFYFALPFFGQNVCAVSCLFGQM